MVKYDNEDQWQAWRIGRDCKMEGYCLEQAEVRFKSTFSTSIKGFDLDSYFKAGFNGEDCPVLTAPQAQ